MADRYNLYTITKHPEEKRPLSNKKKRTYYMRLDYSLLILLSLLLQNTPHLFPTIMGAHAFLLLPLIVCISMFEKNISAAVFAIVAGALWDAATAWGDGFHALFFLVVSSVIVILMKYILRNNMKTALLLSGCTILLYSVVHWLIFSVARGNIGSGMLFLTYYLPSAAYTFLFTFVYYPWLRKIIARLQLKYPRKEGFDEEERP